MKRCFFLLSLLISFSIGQIWAVDYELVYTLDGTVTSGGNSNYAQDGGGLTQSDISWSVTGNTTTSPWRIGGKNLSGVDRLAYSKTAITDNIAKIEIEHGSITLTSVNSLKVEVASNSDFSTVVTTTTETTISANGTITITRPDEKDWSNCYYRLTYNVTAGGSNSYVQLKSVKFYKEKSASDPSLEADPEEVDFGTVEVDASVSSKTVAVTFANLTGSVTYSGLTSPFSASGSISSTGDEITISADASVAGTYEQTLTIQSAADSKSVDVTVKMKVAAPTGNFELYSGTITEGDYVIYYNGKAMKNVVSSNRLGYLDVTPSNDVIENPDESIIWHIAAQSEYWTIYNEAVHGYAAGNGTKNQAQLVATTDYNNSLWEVSGDATYEFINAQNKSSKVNANLRNNGTSGFACYSTSTGGALSLYKKSDGTSKAAAGLAYAEADQKKLTKLGESFTAPTLVNPHGVAVTYASSAESVAEVAANGAVTIKAAGVATITASFAGNDDYKEGSASYTIGVTTKAGTQADPYVAADAKIAIDVMGTVENAYATGIVSNVATTTLPAEGYITFYFSADGLTSGQQIEAYKCYGLNSAQFEALSDVVTGATVVVTGTLKKFNSTYEFDQNCHLVSYEAPAVPKTHIANDQANPYTVAQAIAYAADGVTYDLDDYVYVQGVVYDVKSFNNGAMNIFIKDANAENQFELFKCAGINDGNTTTPFEALTDVQAGNIVIGYGQLTVFNTTYEFKQGNYLVDLQKPVTSVTMDATASVEVDKTVTLTATILPSNATNKSITWSVTSGSDKASVADGVVTGKAEGTAVIRATSAADNTKYAECTVTVTAASAPDARNIANSPATFTATSGNMDPADIAYASYQGGSSTAPAIYNDGIRLYQISGTKTFGGFITLTAKLGCTIDEVQITTTSKYATTVAYSVDGNENLLKSESVAASSSYTTGTGLNVSSVNILNVGTGSGGRLEIASIKVYYTGEAATIDHYELGGTYATEFEVGDEFNHNGLIVYAAFDASGENKSDITSSCTFSTPDMSTEGDKTIEITYNDAVVKSYTITVNASTDTRKVANSPETFTAVSGDMNPADITFASYKGGAGNDPYLASGSIRLYQISGSNTFGGFITLKAKKGCTIDQVKITTTNSYATTVAYSVDGNENLLGSESVAKSSDYSTPSGLNVESVNIVNKGTGGSGRLEIASIKVWYTGDALPVHHYILGGTYETVFEQFGTFSYEGLTVTAAYDAGATITEAVTGFTVEADLSTAGPAKANVMLNSVKIAEYDITVNASAKVDPELAYSPASVILTLGDALSAPTFSNTHNVSPITYSSDKPAVATVDAEGNISLAGGTGVAVITASFAGDDDYIESEATFTITVNEPVEDLTGTWVLATSVAAGDKIIIGATYQDATKSMGAQNGNNRLAVASTLDAGVLSPGEGTKVFTLVDAGDGKFAIQALNGNYLSAAGTGTSNYLKEAADYTADNAKWSISIDGEGVASVVALSENRNAMQYNSGSTLFSCYASVTSQRPINIYKKGTPDYGSYQRSGLTVGNYGTICLPKAGVISGAKLFEVAYTNGSMIYCDQILSGEMAAGVPYFFQATSNQLNVTYSSATVEETAGNANGLYGFYDLDDEDATLPLADNASLGNYILYQNAIYLVDGRAATIANYRAYIKLAEVSTTEPTPASGDAPRRRVAMAVNGEQVATGIDAINASDKPMKLMIDGQLFILRGEKMYDITGSLVK